MDILFQTMVIYFITMTTGMYWHYIKKTDASKCQKTIALIDYIIFNFVFFIIAFQNYIKI